MTVVKSAMAIAACAFVAAAWAEDEEEKSKTEEKADTEEAAKPAEIKAPAKTSFTLLPLCRVVEGKVEARLPRGDWAVAEEGKFYPLGTSFRTGENSRMVLAFGTESTVTISSVSEIATREQKIGEPSRAIALVGGVVDVKLPDNLPEGAFFVSAPGFMVKNPAGNSRYEYSEAGDGDRAIVRCVTGAMTVEGRHFEIVQMRAANEFEIKTSSDNLVTELNGRSGDYAVKLDQGIATKNVIDDAGKVEEKTDKSVNEWHLSPATRVMITRCQPSIGTNMCVHTMCFDASGQLKSECLFCENRAEINSGELVPRDEKNQEELAKKAAEATTEEAAADEDESKDEEKKDDEKKDDEKKDDKKEEKSEE